MDVLKIEKLTKKFDKQVVLNNMSMSVKEGSVFGFIGKNGAGKTTTMKIIVGLLKTDGGSVQVLGEDVTYGQTKTNRHIGYLPDVPSFYGYMTSMEYLKLCGETANLDKGEIKKKSLELLDLVGLENNNKRISGFSRGMKQRLGIAQALLSDPKLLICDEPTSALDPIGRKEILDILLKIKDKTTVMFSTHVLSDVESICDNVALLHNGEIVLSGAMEDIKKQFQNSSIKILFAENDLAIKFKEVLNENNIKCEIKNNELVVKSENLMKIEEKIINLFSQHSIFPIKFEITDPTLEELVLEVIK